MSLSEELNRLPGHVIRPDAQRFRNPNGVYMKLSNFLRFDDSYAGSGLTHGGKLEEEVWRDFATDRDRLRRVADAIRAVSAEPVEATGAILSIDDEFEAPEGSILVGYHRYRERNASLSRKKKASVLSKTGTLACEVCGFVFKEKYGLLGQDIIDCHHIVPLAQLRPEKTTKLSDLSLVCPNCHRMLHKGKDAPTLEALRDIINSD
ncbi:MAG: HNH endonuclease [SAR202 cluster bacterium]|nr:HNH endonuclease [SAR202 cluster bacterium]